MTFKALVLSYWFPPMGGAGTQRMAKTCKYLPDHGWDPIVLAGEPTPDEHAPFLDTSLVADLGKVRVFRHASTRAATSRRLLDVLRFRLGMDAWVDSALPIALQLAKEYCADAIVTSLSPFSGYRLGKAVRHALGIPWIMDLRDPWALDGWRSWPSPFHAAWDLSEMRKALSLADAIVANTPEAARAYQELGASADKLAIIPNGFDEDDFPLPGSSDGEHFALLHVGTLHPADTRPGLTRNTLFSWRHRQVAPLGRSGHFLIKALARLREHAPAIASRMRVVLVGRVDDSHVTLARALGVIDSLDIRGYLPHKTALEEMSKAHALFVPLHDVPPGERALVVPAKLYEALASGRPILASLPPGDGADLVDLLAAGTVVSPCDEASTAIALERMARTPTPAEPSRRLALGAFTRRSLAERFAQTLTLTLGRQSLSGLGDPWEDTRRLLAHGERVPNRA